MLKNKLKFKILFLGLFLVTVLIPLKTRNIDLMAQEVENGETSDPGKILRNQPSFSLDNANMTSEIESDSTPENVFSPESNLGKPIDPNSYIVGPGDSLMLITWGVIKKTIPIIVGPEGKIFINEIGDLHISGLNLAKTKAKVISLMKKVYPNQKFNLLLSKERQFKVYVLGEVKNPGTYLGSPLKRISDVIKLAGGIQRSGTKRRIEIRRNGSTFYADLFLYRKYGELDKNPFLLDNDIIFVPVSLPKVTIGGGIKQSGVFELERGETLSQFIKRLGGFTSHVSFEKSIKVVRFTKGHRKEIIKIDINKNLDNGGKDLVLRDGDTIFVPSIDAVAANETSIYVSGEVKKPGAYPYLPGYTAKSYIGMAGGLTPRARFSQAQILKTDGRKIPLDEDTVLELGDTIYIPEKFIKVWQDCLVITTSISSLTLAVIAAFK